MGIILCTEAMGVHQVSCSTAILLCSLETGSLIIELEAGLALAVLLALPIPNAGVTGVHGHIRFSLVYNLLYFILHG